MKKLVIIDYGSGNVESFSNSLNLITKNHEIIISKDLQQIKDADRLVLPGVGSFADCMDGLNATPGLLEEIKQQVLVEKKPFFGVCVGMQVLASIGYEDGTHQGLDFIKGQVKRIEAKDDLKIPHMGWNDVVLHDNNHPVLQGIETGDHFYFANSYHFDCEEKDNIFAYVEYGQEICAIVAKENIIGVQFHPEKSGEKGLKILKNFLDF